MPTPINILWSGLAGHTGIQAAAIAKDSMAYAITDGMTTHPRSRVLQSAAELLKDVHWHPYSQNVQTATHIQNRVHVIVDFSHYDCLSSVIDLCCRIEKPFVHCGCGLRPSDSDMALLHRAANRIPVFHSHSLSRELRSFLASTINHTDTAYYTLAIAKVMTKKSPSKLYAMEDVWPDLQHLR